MLYIQTQVVGLQEGVNGAGLRRSVTSSVTLWAIHAGQSDWMPDWIIRNSAGADLKRKSGKVQHWGVGGRTPHRQAVQVAVCWPHHSAQVSIQVLHSSSWPWMQATSPAGHPQLPAAAAGRPVHKTATIENDQQGCKGNRGTRGGIVAKPFLMECHP